MLELVQAYGAWLLLGALFLVMLCVRTSSDCCATLPRDVPKDDGEEGERGGVRGGQRSAVSGTWREWIAPASEPRGLQEGSVGVTLAHRDAEATRKVSGGGCGRRRLLRRLCRWALPAAFLLGAVALWLGGAMPIGLALVGLLLPACPLVCILLLFWEGRESKRAIAAAEALRDRARGDQTRR